jgi:DNA-binding response OmpR family regulator
MANPAPTPEVFARLKRLHDDVITEEYELREEICQIGRSVTCHVVINPEKKVVSRIHAEIRRNGLRYVLNDVGSANHTFVNERRIVEPHILKHEDRIGLGGPIPLVQFIDHDPTYFIDGGLRYDDRGQKFYYNDKVLNLTPSQLRLLTHLYHNAGQLCTYVSCAEAIWGSRFEPGQDAEALHRVVNMLRKQLRDVAPEADLIQTRRELGYQLDL